MSSYGPRPQPPSGAARADRRLLASPPPQRPHRTAPPAAAATRQQRGAASSAHRSGPPPASVAASSSSAPPPPPPYVQQQQQQQQQPAGHRQTRPHGRASNDSRRGDSPTLGTSSWRLPPHAQQRPQRSPRQHHSESSARSPSSSWRTRSQASRAAPTSALPPVPSAPPSSTSEADTRRSASQSPDQRLSIATPDSLSPNNFLDLFPSPEGHARDTSPETRDDLVAAARALRQAQESPSRPSAPGPHDRPMLCSQQVPMPTPLGDPLKLASGQRKRLPIVPLPVVPVASPLASPTTSREASGSPLENRKSPSSGPNSGSSSLSDRVAAGLSSTLAAAHLRTTEAVGGEPELTQEALNVLNSTPMPLLLVRALAKINDLEIALEYFRDTCVRASADAVFWESQYQRLVRDFLKLETQSRASARRTMPSWPSPHEAAASDGWQRRESSATAYAQPQRRESTWDATADPHQHSGARTDSHPQHWRDSTVPNSDGPSDVATGLQLHSVPPLNRRGAWRRGSAETARQHQRSSSEGFEAVGPSTVPAAVRMAHLAARRPSSSSTPRRRSETTPLAEEIMAKPREVPARQRSPALEWMRSSSVSECGESAPPEHDELAVSSDDQVYHETHADAGMPLSAPSTEAWRAVAAPALRERSDVPIDETSDPVSSPGAQHRSGDCITSIDNLERLAISSAVMAAGRDGGADTRMRASHIPTTAGPQYLLQARRPFSFTPSASPSQALRLLGSPFLHHDSPASAATHGPLTPLDGFSPFISPRTSVDSSPSFPADPFAWRPFSGLALSFGGVQDEQAPPLRSYWSESTCPSTEESDDNGALEAWRRGCVAAPPSSTTSSPCNDASSASAAVSFDYARDAPGTLQDNPSASKGGVDALFFGSSPSPKQRPAPLPNQVQHKRVHEF